MARRFRNLAQKIVLDDSIRSYDPVKKARGQRKLEKLLEFEERRKSMKQFMRLWNRWREFYFKLPPLEIKTAGQLTIIENAIDHFKEKSLDLNLVIACLHKSYERSVKFRPSFNDLISKGEDRYRQHLDDVESDIERVEIERLGLGE